MYLCYIVLVGTAFIVCSVFVFQYLDVKQKYPTLTAYRVPVVWRRHRGRGLLLNISKVRQK